MKNIEIAGEVLVDQTQNIVQLWRSQIIASIPHIARHSRSPEGSPLPNYLEPSNRRFEQWILDTCLAKGHSDKDVRSMHRAWCKSLQLQIALWAKTYMDFGSPNNQW